jgi:hypothetical protein
MAIPYCTNLKWNITKYVTVFIYVYLFFVPNAFLQKGNSKINNDKNKYSIFQTLSYFQPVKQFYWNMDDRERESLVYLVYLFRLEIEVNK